MPFPNQHAKRSQPVDVDEPTSSSNTKSTRKGASGASKNTNPTLSTSSKSAKVSGTSLSPSSLSPANSSGSSHGGTTPSSAGYGYHDLHKTSKKLSKAIRGGGTSHGGGGGGKQFKVKQRKIGDGPEAELSADEETGSDWNPDEVEDQGVDTEGMVERDSVERSTGTNVQVDMVSLLAGAKLRPESANISRGYEMITSPASKMIIPFDQHPSNNKGTTNEDEEWENVHFDMDMDDVYENVLSASTTMSVHVHAAKSKDAYADVVKRV